MTTAQAGGIEFPVRRPSIPIFRAGELHEIEVTYLGIPGLNVTLELLPDTLMNGRKVHHARGTVVTSAIVSLFFRVHDTVESWFDQESLFSHRLELVQNESKIQRKTVEALDPVTGEASFKNQWKKPNGENSDTTEHFSLPRMVQDSLSAAYFLRTLPMTQGAVYVIPVESEGKIARAQATVTGLKRISTRFGRIDAYGVSLAKLDDAGNAMPGPQNVVYLSTDRNRRLLEFNVWSRFGQISATLRKYVEGAAKDAGL